MKLHPDQALGLGLIVTELISNSIKHGFSDRADGVISLVLTSDGTGTAILHVTDNGRSFDPSTVTKGIGLRLLKGFATQLNGEYTLDGREGLDFRMSFPLTGPPAFAHIHGSA